ncbi:MAG: helix-turn-helix domain-containing protein [Roseovarius pacificus]|nr:helix-turn-helix domain-containing protein [Roseovarius pacificus]
MDGQSTQIDPERMMTEADVADLLCQSIRTLQKWRVTGYGPCFHKIGRSVRYRRGDVLDWTAERRRAHTSAA